MKSTEIDYFLHQLNTAFCLLNWRMDTFYLEPSEKNKDFLNNEIQYLKNMLGSFMTYKKLPNSFKERDYDSINLNSFMINVLEKFNICKNNKNISYFCSDDFENKNIKTHPFYFEELCRIFLENALKYTPAKEKISVDFIFKKDGGSSICFRNTGVGISEDDMVNIWQPFFTNDDNNGSGLGLSIAKQISKSLNFEVSCESDGSSFTNFFIHIPNNSVQ